MKIFVTGATGLVGSHVVRRAVAEGHDVTLFRRPTSSLRALRGVRPKEVVGDICDRAALFRGMKHSDLVIHSAALITYNRNRVLESHRANVEGTHAVVEAAGELAIPKVIYVSSIVTIASSLPGSLANEETPYNLKKWDSPYFVSKRVAEEMVLQEAKKGLPVVIVNPAAIFGPYDYNLHVTSYVRAVAQRKVRWWVRGGTNFVDVEDVVDGIFRAAEQGRIGERYILGGENVEIRDLLLRIASLTGVRAPQSEMPIWYYGGLKALLRTAEQFGYRGELTSDLIERVTKLRLFFDLSKAQNELGYFPRPIEDALRRTYDWLKKDQLI